MITKMSGRLFMVAVVLVTIGCVTGGGAMGEEVGEITDLSRLPKNLYSRASDSTGSQTPIHTVPTGFSGVPPAGPAMPVTATASDEHKASRHP